MGIAQQLYDDAVTSRDDAVRTTGRVVTSTTFAVVGVLISELIVLVAASGSADRAMQMITLVAISGGVYAIVVVGGSIVTGWQLVWRTADPYRSGLTLLTAAGVSLVIAIWTAATARDGVIATFSPVVEWALIGSAQFGVTGIMITFAGLQVLALVALATLTVMTVWVTYAGTFRRAVCGAVLMYIAWSLWLGAFGLLLA